MKKISKIGISMIISLAILGGSVFATTGKVYNTSQGLVLRGAASKSGAALATVAEGTEFEIIEKSGDWYKVKANGQEGYLYAEYVRVVEETPVAPADNTPANTASGDKQIHILPLITSSTIGTVPAGTELNIEKTIGKWNYISYQNIKGWVRANVEVTETTAPVEEQQEEKPAEEPQQEQPVTEKPATTEPEAPQENTNLSYTKGYINESSVNVRKAPTTSSEIVTTLILNTGVTITAQTDEWYKVTYGDYVGYIYKPLISENPVVTNRSGETRDAAQAAESAQTTTNVATQAENATPAAVEQQPAVAATPAPSSSGGQKIVDFAKQYLGYSYVYGGTTPSGGFDCSGFVYYVFNSCGYSISRSCTTQAQTGTAVSKSELQPGDIVFFNNTSSGAIGHVGIYIGGGNMVHAANPRRGVVIDTINSGYYNTYYYSARRIAN